MRRQKTEENKARAKKLSLKDGKAEESKTFNQEIIHVFFCYNCCITKFLS